MANRAPLKGPTSDGQGGNDETTRRARAEEIPIFPANAVMMGIRIPASLDRIRLRFEPFSSTRAAHVLMLLAVLIFLAAIGALLGIWAYARPGP